MDDQILKLVCESYREVLDAQDIPSPRPEVIDAHTLIYDSNGYLDSLGLINLVVTMEQRIRDQLNVSIALATERVMSQATNPFKSVQSLTLYVEELVKAKNLQV